MKREEDKTCEEIIYDENYIESVRRIYLEDVERTAQDLGVKCYTTINDEFTIFFQEVPEGKDCVTSSGPNYYTNISFLWGFNLESTNQGYSISPGIIEARRERGLRLSGKDVLIGVVGTGINYLHEAFIYEDGTTKIYSIWDQTIKGAPPEGFLYGTEYKEETINEALKSQDPKAIVPSEDEDGHGTYIAGVAAGRQSNDGKFQGMAVDSNLIIVKLKKAKSCLKNYFGLPEKAVAYQSSDLIMGVKYLADEARKRNQPLVILFTAETNNGPHDGTSYSETIYESFASLDGVNFVASSGDEASALHHYKGTFDKEKESQAEFNIAKDENGIALFIWSFTPDEFEIKLTTPGGNTTEAIKAAYNQPQNIKLGLEGTEIQVISTSVDIRTGDQSTIVILRKPLEGIWSLKLFGKTIVHGQYHIWMPIKNFTKPNTIFTDPDPYVTIVTPCTNRGIFSVSAYDSVKNSIYIQSGRGYTRRNVVKPDLVAAGVSVIGPGLQKSDYVVKAGSAVAASVVAGACAKLLQWGIVNKNDITMNTMSSRSLLISGAKRDKERNYPNREWGYGVLDLYNTILLT